MINAAIKNIRSGRHDFFNLLPIEINHSITSIASRFKSNSSAKAPNNTNIVTIENDSEAHISATLISHKLETSDTKSYFFRADQDLNDFKAGSHINIKFWADGEPISRTYTLSSSPKQTDTFSITVKCIPGGLASNWLFNNLNDGDSILVSQPQGQFVLPPQPAGKILMLSAGSGITPLMSMLRYLSETGNRSDITFLHYARSMNDAIFLEELTARESKQDNLKLHIVVENSPPGDNNTASEWLTGRINQSQLSRVIPDINERELYLCGPQPFMEATISILEKLAFNPAQLHQENFNLELNAAKFAYSAQVTFDKSKVSIQALASKTLLEEAEAQGLSPASACRMGICKTCRCQKISGTTVNIVTGKESSMANEYILPCITVAKTDTSIAL